jgi:hypothetical protein
MSTKIEHISQYKVIIQLEGLDLVEGHNVGLKVAV